MDNIKNLEGMGRTTQALTIPAAEGVIVQYTSHPIMNYAIGNFVFVNGLLSLRSQEEVDEFEKVINDKNFPRQERSRIRKIDLEAATRIAEAHIAASRTVSQNTDSSLGARGIDGSKTGKTDLKTDSSGGAVGTDPVTGGKVAEEPLAVDSEGKVKETKPAGLAGLHLPKHD